MDEQFVSPPSKEPISSPGQLQPELLMPIWLDPAWLAEPDTTTIGESE